MGTRRREFENSQSRNSLGGVVAIVSLQGSNCEGVNIVAPAG
ncbi:hypothetical protein CRENPOLYSF1_630016 [Crenothrix polyspora]|uniref:Uncharacterized protein n=1 Tax=Crenothrix polyspora TaxID=360316 RepID=A0A1R4HFQ8_9GAMM|nr:hypothetical protein CRENPOLYSF1_630016 [Crenothrix polyspora]